MIIFSIAGDMAQNVAVVIKALRHPIWCESHVTKCFI